MLKRASIKIKGDVQMAGFRTFIKNTADSLNVNGFAENLEDRSVRVVCEGEEGAIEGLINLVKQNPPSFVRIEEVAVAYEEYKGEFSSFERRGVDVPGEEVTRENDMVTLMRSFDKKGEVMVGILGSMNETLGSMNETLGSMNEALNSVKKDTSKMLGKHDETINAIGEVSEKIDGSKEEMVTQISSLRDDLRSYMEYKFAKIEHDVEAIKAKIGMI
jgi:acylphosphatase/uncharacterized protein YoxC